MLILAGSFTFDPADRDAFLEARTPLLLATRQEPGCLEYVMAADPADETRVVLLEKWADQAALDQHMVVLRNAGKLDGPAPTSMVIKVYDASGERNLF